MAETDWRQVVCKDDERTDFMRQVLGVLIPAYASAPNARDIVVRTRQEGTVRSYFVFSPAAAALVDEELRAARAVPVPPPDLNLGYTRIYLGE